MRSSVVVNGVTLTRAQVEQAQLELDAPQYLPGQIYALTPPHAHYSPGRGATRGMLVYRIHADGTHRTWENMDGALPCVAMDGPEKGCVFGVFPECHLGERLS